MQQWLFIISNNNIKIFCFQKSTRYFATYQEYKKWTQYFVAKNIESIVKLKIDPSKVCLFWNKRHTISYNLNVICVHTQRPHEIHMHDFVIYIQLHVLWITFVYRPTCVSNNYLHEKFHFTCKRMCWMWQAW